MKGNPEEKRQQPAKHMNEEAATVGTAAYTYLSRNWCPIPLRPLSKAPCGKDWPNFRLTPGSVDRHFSDDNNIGLILGSASGNLTDVDLDSPEAAAAAIVLLPPTPMKHGRGGDRTTHYWYTCDRSEPTVRLKAHDGSCLIELRSGTLEQSAQTMVPPSIHPDTKELLRWEGPLEPAFVPYDVLLRAVHDVAVAALMARYWNSGTRHDLALVFAGYLAVGGVGAERACALVRGICHAARDEEANCRLRNVDTTYAEFQAGNPVVGRAKFQEMVGQDVIKCLDKWLGIRPGHVQNNNISIPSSSTPLEFELTDLGNARRFVARFRGKVLHVPAWGWMYWDGKRWARDEIGIVNQYVHETVDNIREEAEKIARTEDKLRVLRWHHQSQSNARLKAIPEIAASIEPIPCSSALFDTKSTQFNVLNGTVDLERGTIANHNPDDLFSKVAPVEYRPDAVCPRFLAFLGQIFAGDTELIAYVQKIFGHILIGGNPEQLFIILFGHGANGKSVLVNTIMDILGPDYAQQMNPETIMERTSNGGAPRNDLACLQGVRLAAVAETGDRNRLNEALVKQLTGGERIRARFLYQEEFEFLPQFTVILSTNHKPYVSDVGHAIWRRLRLVPFNVTIPRDDQDSDLTQKLLQEKEGIFNWLVEGCRMYLEEGLDEPAVVHDATTGYRQEMDTLGAFLDQMTVANPGGNVRSQQLFDTYRTWCEDMGLRPSSQMKLARRLEERGFTKTRRNNGIFWHGLELVPVDVIPEFAFETEALDDVCYPDEDF